ncbi:MAG: PAS and helix-turn-helix domain-containing protein [Chloroflexi bacterium]|nr:PAS and helix-turn-helix domain-containing protein [Chloroflexota bacterium]
MGNLAKETERHVRGEFRTSDGMFTVSTDQKIKSWNAAAEKLFGYTREQVVGKKCYETLCANGNSGRVNCSRGCVVVTNAAKGRTTRDFDLQCRTSDGELKSLNMSIVLPAQDSESREILHLFRDVTDRRRVESASAPQPVQDLGQSKKTATGSGLSPNGYRLPPLTTREDQVLKLLAAGKNTTDIAEILTIRPLTARNHISRLLTKLGCRSRLEAVALGTRAGLI